MTAPAPETVSRGRGELFAAAAYDRDPLLRAEEREALAVLEGRKTRGQYGSWPKHVHAALARLRRPLDDVLGLVAHERWRERHATVRVLVDAMHQRQTAFWAWSREEWLTLLQDTDADIRQYAMAVAYLLCDQRDLHLAFPGFKRLTFAWKVLGRAELEASLDRVGEEITGWGYGPSIANRAVIQAACELLLLAGSPQLEAMTPELILTAHRYTTTDDLRHGLIVAARALVSLGFLAASPFAADAADDWLAGTTAVSADVPAEWVAWCQRWYRTSTLVLTSRKSTYYQLLKAGHWLGATHPEATSPERWTREVAAAWVAAVDRMKIGEWTHAPMLSALAQRAGTPIRPRTKVQQLTAVRRLFQDCQDWGWIPWRFDPTRVFAVPRSIAAQVAPDPRIIADDVWAKLLWAGLNLTAEDVPRHASRDTSWYPPPMVRAVVLVWLFAGLRMDELSRLRVGCSRWQREDVAVPGTDQVLPKDAVCLLHVPAHKTGAAYTKPVDRVVGEAIQDWERVRPTQPPFVDLRTGEVVHFLFAYRGKRMSWGYLNRCLIPLLCRKANVPTADARGNITSHRARSTIATQLFNAKEPMSLVELQEWLGHRTPQSTQHYAKITPTKLAKSFHDAGYLERNVRMIEVLLDQDAIKTGAAAQNQPWRFYDLGHGYCTYDFFDQCPHRMACAKCAFYLPKGSTRAQLLEGKANLQRMLQAIPLTDDERAAVEDGLTAHERLLATLADVPTPAGPTPRDLAGEAVIPLHPMPPPRPEANP